MTAITVINYLLVMPNYFNKSLEVTKIKGKIIPSLFYNC